MHGLTGGTSAGGDIAMGDPTAACLLPLYHMEKMVPGSSFRWAAGGRDDRQSETGDVPTWDRENTSTVPINEPPAQTAPRGWAVAILGGFQDPARQSPDLDLMADPILSSRLG